jgi:hypothetical protein
MLVLCCVVLVIIENMSKIQWQHGSRGDWNAANNRLRSKDEQKTMTFDPSKPHEFVNIQVSIGGHNGVTVDNYDQSTGLHQL